MVAQRVVASSLADVQDTIIVALERAYVGNIDVSVGAVAILFSLPLD